MAITAERVREIFKKLEKGDGAAFFEHVTDDVDWTVMGTHPLAGRYRSKKSFIAGTFAKLGQILPQGASSMWSISSSRMMRRWSSFIPSRRPRTACALTTAIVGSCISKTE